MSYSEKSHYFKLTDNYNNVIIYLGKCLFTQDSLYKFDNGINIFDIDMNFYNKVKLIETEKQIANLNRDTIINLKRYYKYSDFYKTTT